MSDAIGFLIEREAETTEPWRRALREGADQIERGGWWQCKSADDCNDTSSASCAVTSMTGVGAEDEATIRLARFLGFEGPDEEAPFFVFDWNDTRENVAQVTTAMRACAHAPTAA